LGLDQDGWKTGLRWTVNQSRPCGWNCSHDSWVLRGSIQRTRSGGSWIAF
jgi:hypothetical protein